MASALSVDALFASFAYGSRKIRIPVRSLLLISFLCSGVLGLTLFLGVRMAAFIDEGVAAWLSFGILFCLGMGRIFDSWLKAWIRKRGPSNSEIRLRVFHLKFILQVYIDPPAADVDGSRSLSVGEAGALAIALSLDAVAAGLGIGLGGANVLPVTIIKFFMTMVAVFVGCKLGGKLAAKVQKDLSWLSGGLLILLAVLQIV